MLRDATKSIASFRQMPELRNRRLKQLATSYEENVYFSNTPQEEQEKFDYVSTKIDYVLFPAPR